MNFRSLNAVGYKTLVTAIIAVSLLSAACSGSEEATAEDRSGSTTNTPIDTPTVDEPTHTTASGTAVASIEAAPIASPALAPLPGNVFGSSVSVSDGPVLILPPSQERAIASAGDVAAMVMESLVDEGQFLEAMEVNPEQGQSSPLTPTTVVATTTTTTTIPVSVVEAGDCFECSENFFEYWGVNDFVRTSDDALSTFALDVDTASYTVARNFLAGGQLPPPAAVRVEEFVNYFDGGYEAVEDLFTLSLDAARSPFAAEGNVLLRVGVRAPDDVSSVSLPESVILVIDRSGSMDEPSSYEGEYIPRYRLVHRSVEFLLDSLPLGTRVGIVAYEDAAVRLLEPTSIDSGEGTSTSSGDIYEVVSTEILPGGSTNAGAGLALGYDMALEEAEMGRSVLVIFFSDGVANVGSTRTDDILEDIGDRGEIGLTSIGVGLGPLNDELLEQLANRADGTYHYVDGVEQARRIFVDDFTSLLAVAARDAKIQVEFNPETVEFYRLIGFENRAIADEDFRNDVVDAGEVGLGQSSTALYELKLKQQASDLARIGELALASLRYQHAGSGEILELSSSITGSDVAESLDSANVYFQLAAVAAEFAEVLRASPFVRQENMQELRAQAISLAEALPAAEEVPELANLIKLAAQLKGENIG